MIQLPDSNWSDQKIIECIHHWAIESAKCGLDGELYNKISDKYFTPCAQILKRRGTEALAKLLPLLQDKNPDVRLTAASIAYEVDPGGCRRVLVELMKTPDRIGIMAWGSLAVLDPKNAPKPTELWGEE